MKLIKLILGIALCALAAGACASKRLPLEQPPFPGAYLIPKKETSGCIASAESIDPNSDYDWCFTDEPAQEQVNSSNHFVE